MTQGKSSCVLEDATDEHLLLLGYPPAAEFFHLVRTQVSDGERLSAATLAREWRAANEHVRGLRASEAGIADQVPLEELPAALVELARLCLQSPPLRYSQEITPRRWAIVELERLIVIQRRISLGWTSELKSILGAEPTDGDLVRFATGALIPQPRVRVVRGDDARYILTCDSGELQFLGSRKLDPRACDDGAIGGHTAHLLGLFVGFGVNVMCALHYRGRLILTNGTHRAYALKELGIAHAPCLILDAAHEDELELLGMRELRPQIERYVRSARPPLLKDYFDPALRKIVPLMRARYALELKVTATTLRVPSG